MAAQDLALVAVPLECTDLRAGVDGAAGTRRGGMHVLMLLNQTREPVSMELQGWMGRRQGLRCVCLGTSRALDKSPRE